MRGHPFNPFHSASRSLRRSPQDGGTPGGGLVNSFQKTVLYGGGAFILLNTLFLIGMQIPSGNNHSEAATAPLQSGGSVRKQVRFLGPTTKQPQCNFRQYPPRRYYGLHKLEQPDFLSTVEYVYGKLPIMVLPDSDVVDYKTHGKLCVDQSEWLPKSATKELPFADGTNPSILSLDRLQKSYPSLVETWKSQGGSYIATICMTDSQCSYQDSEEDIKNFRLSQQKKPTVIQTLLLILDDQFQSLAQTTIYLERNAPWGRKYKKAITSKDGGFERKAFALDDARLFIHLDKLWVSFREGPSFGYEQQVLNEIHMDIITADGSATANNKGKNQFTATIKASESASFCCGRNMALMEHLEDPTQLQSLTWADPVTVIDVDDGRRKGDNSQPKRRLVEKKRKSHFHGTNAFMVYLPASDEFLGIGHFHRPSGRDAFNKYARFGHHYTHTFFTISSKPPFRLTRLSQEFVLPSKSKILQHQDADIIQFLSGLEVTTRNGRDYAVIAYGINDCEGAAIYLSMDKVNQMLLSVEEGKEVVDLMEPLKKTAVKTTTK